MTTLQRYNGLDTIATFQLWKVLEAQLDSKPWARQTYDLSTKLSDPAMYAMLRGILVDTTFFNPLREQFIEEIGWIEDRLDFITQNLGLGIINLASPMQVKWLFECLKCPLSSSDRAHIEKALSANPDLAPICNLILMWRDRAKMLQSLNPSMVDPDGRMRTFYRIAGTVSGRWSSSENALWSGTNLQNIKRDVDEDKSGYASLRRIFIADKGKKFLNFDLERADSWAVGLEAFACSGDMSYVEACGSFDLHTYVSRLVWSNLGWTGDPAKDQKIAKQFFYRQYDYRFMSKKGGHGTNYGGQARTLAAQMKIPIVVAQEFQDAYFEAFPGIAKWQHHTAKTLQTTASLTNLFGRRRNFHDRLDSMATLREGLGYLGQSTTSDYLNRCILNLWDFQKTGAPFEFLAQVHDSVLIQYEPEQEELVLKMIKNACEVDIETTAPNGLTLSRQIPIEISVGWNWSAESEHNPDGLKKVDNKDERTRTAEPEGKTLHFMDRRVSSVFFNPPQSPAVP